MGLFTIGAVLFTLPLSWAGAMYPWSSWRTIVPFVIGVIVLVVFGWYESKPAEPMFPYRIFRNKTASATLAGSFIHGNVLYTLIAYVPLFFQAILLKSPLEAAVALIPFFAVLMAFTGIAAMGVEYTRRYLWEVWAGWVLLSIGVGLFSLWGLDSQGMAMSAGFQVISAIGIGSLFTVLPIPMQASAERTEDQGLAVGMLVAFRLFGALVGLAVASTAFNSQFRKAIEALDVPAGIPQPDLNDALSFIPGLRDIEMPADTLRGIQYAYEAAFRVVFYILAGLGAVGSVLSLLTKELTIESEETGKQAFEG